MIDCAVVVSDGGCVLWNQRFDQGYEDNDGGSTRTMLNKLIQTVILEVGYNISDGCMSLNRLYVSATVPLLCVDSQRLVNACWRGLRAVFQTKQ